MEENTKLPLDIKTKWLKALRSKRYKQGQKRLRNADNQYCCLGVLCNVSRKGRWIKVEGYPKYAYKIKGGNEEVAGLPSVLSSELKISMLCAVSISVEDYNKLPFLPINRDNREITGTNLANINDYGGTFAQIADIIEKYL